MSKYDVKKTPAGILYLEMPEELSLLEDFMIIDLHLNNVQSYLERINSVMDQNTKEEISGNSTVLTIKKNQTKVYNIALDQECTLETRLLKHIISLYYKESLQDRLERRIESLQVILEKTKEIDNLAEILELTKDIQKRDII
jgi:hypothetical protein